MVAVPAPGLLSNLKRCVGKRVARFAYFEIQQIHRFECDEKIYILGKRRPKS